MKIKMDTHITKKMFGDRIDSARNVSNMPNKKRKRVSGNDSLHATN
jgi:hypothetical protein